MKRKRKGFFKKEDLQSAAKPMRRRNRCGTCGLWKNCKNPKMEPAGRGRKRILIIGESPSKMQDTRGTQLIGESTKILRKSLSRFGIDLDKDCWKMDAVCCHVPGDRLPTDIEIDSCRDRVWKTIKDLSPRAVILLGNIAVRSVIGGRWKKDLDGIQKWRGWSIPDRDIHGWVFPTYHPSYVLKMDNHPVIRVIFDQDIKNVVDNYNKDFPTFPNEDDQIEVYYNKEDVETYLLDVLKYKPNLLAFDYEATGLKPHAAGHRIACVSMCWQLDRAAVWPWDLTPIPLFRKIMESRDIGKVASNMKFEKNWTKLRARGIDVENFVWDTMISAHCLDNRSGITSLKFDCYVRYGVIDYDSDISSYLRSDKKENGANGMNRVFEAPQHKLLLYCGKDSLFELRLAVDQITEFNAGIPIFSPDPIQLPDNI